MDINWQTAVSRMRDEHHSTVIHVSSTYSNGFNAVSANSKVDFFIKLANDKNRLVVVV